MSYGDKMSLNKLSFSDKFGQMLIIGLDIYEINDEVIKLIEKYKIGGVILYRKNYTSIETMVNVINKLKKINRGNKIPLFIAIDQENGKVNRLPKEIVRIKSPYKQGMVENIKVINSINDITTYILKSVGVNMNFAPVLDINRDFKNKVIGSRSYGKDVDSVVKYGIPFMKCMKENNIVSVIKHFPGHGATTKDSRISKPWLNNISLLEKEDMKPFEVAIENGCDAIMTGHLRIKGYGLKPVTYNKRILEECLINKYNGLIVTDDLRMGIMRFTNMKKKIIKCVEAGNNLILVKYKKGDISRIYRDLYKMVDNYEIDIEKIDNSYKKIVNIKKKYDINDSEINVDLNIKLINDRIRKINDIIDKELGV